VGLVADQEAVATVTNATSATVTATVTLLDASGQVLVRENLDLAPRHGAAVRWRAAGAVRVRATVETPGAGASRYPIGLFVYETGAPNPSLASQANVTLGGQQGTTAALSPYVPVIIAAKVAVPVVNLGSTTATFTVSFFDGDGNPVSNQTLTVAPGRIGVAQLPAPLANGARAVVRGPAGTPYLVSHELVDEATGKTIALLLGR
jgi:hypothetical protein